MSTTCRQRNARFWTYHRTGWVKLTLRPEQSLSVAYGYRHDEGYTREYATWVYEDGTEFSHACTEGSDCDGPHRFVAESMCPLADLRARDMYAKACEWYPGSPTALENWGVFAPQWQPVSYDQRDVFAEAMGY